MVTVPHLLLLEFHFTCGFLRFLRHHYRVVRHVTERAGVRARTRTRTAGRALAPDRVGSRTRTSV